jgi:uncharacterized protein
MSIYHSIYDSKVKIKDKIHDYISLTQIELKIIETDIFQRLRNISQSGLIHTVYPANRTSRFEHSLGCLYLSGLFIENMLANSAVYSKISLDQSDANDGITIKESFLNTFIEQYSKDYNKDEINDYIHKLKSLNKEFSKSQILEAIIWQSVRICGLLHDIGHLPFSHDLEGIINKNLNLLELSDEEKVEYLRFYNGKYHEFATIRLIKDQKLKNCFEGHIPVYNTVIKIFQSKTMNKHHDTLINSVKNKKDIYATLLDIVDNEIDADRGDYLKRDGKSSGVEMGNYDLNRLIQNMNLLMTEKKEFFIRPTQYASSIVEQFLMERYRIYQYVHFHQKSVLVNTLLGRIVSYLLSPESYDINIDTRIDGKNLNYNNYIQTNIKEKKFNEPFDDISIIGIIRKAYGELCFIEKDKLSDNEKFLKNIIEISFYRKKNYIPLWKKNEDYIQIYNSKIKPALERITNNHSLNELSQKYLLDLTSIEALEEIIDKYIPENIPAKIIISPKHFQLIKDDYFIINTKTKKWTILNIGEFAPLLFQAKTIWEDNIQIFCYAILKSNQLKVENIKLIPILTDSFIKGITEWFENNSK